jgi:hypothetical protein
LGLKINHLATLLKMRKQDNRIFRGDFISQSKGQNGRNSFSDKKSLAVLFFSQQWKTVTKHSFFIDKN